MTAYTESEPKPEHQIRLLMASSDRVAVTCACQQAGGGYSKTFGTVAFGAMPEVWKIYGAHLLAVEESEGA